MPRLRISNIPFFLILGEIQFKRKHDPETGFPELEIFQAEGSSQE